MSSKLTFEDTIKADKQILIRLSEKTKSEWQLLANKYANGRMSTLVKEAVELFMETHC